MRKYYITEQGNGAPPQSVKLASVIDTDLLKKMIDEGYIKVTRHPDDPDLQILSYSVLAQVQGKWNDATKAARGLIVRGTTADDTVVVERPWEKFFTLSQMDNSWHLGDEENISSADSFATLDFDAPADVYDKLDGSLGILYRDPKGVPAFATKGSFTSDQSEMFTKILRNDLVALKAAEEILNEGSRTALFELIGPNNRIVLAYPKEEIVLLGGVVKESGANVNPEDMIAWNKRGLPQAERISAQTLRDALALPNRENREGFVVSVGGVNPMKIKIKQEDYLRLHRIVTSFSPKESRKLIKGIKATYKDLFTLAETRDVNMFEDVKNVVEIEGFSKNDPTYASLREQRLKFFEDALFLAATRATTAKNTIDSLDESWFVGADAPKRFALNVDKLEGDKSTLFLLFRARLKGEDIETMSAESEMNRASRDAPTFG